MAGILSAHLITVEALERTEDHVVLCGQTGKGKLLDQEVLEKMLIFPASGFNPSPVQTEPMLEAELSRRKTEIVREVTDRNLKYFETEVEKLDTWSDDLKVGLEQEIKELDKEIREIRRTAKAAPDLEEKLNRQKRLGELEKLRSKKRRELFDKQDEVDNHREGLIGDLEDKLEQKIEEKHLFSLSWRVN